jgi:cobyrinic acid a,c-diamide synthase
MVAEALDLPVVLVVDATAGMESVAATALGFEQYAETIGRDIEVAGIVAQRAHGGRHAQGIRDALPATIDYFGRIPPADDLEIPDRHLGLQMGAEASLPATALSDAGETVDVEALAAVAQTPPEPEPADGPEPTGARIGVASDAAFCFRYPATMERLRALGTVETFSPVANDPLPDCDGFYLPGGYPELHGASLAESATLAALGRRAAEGVPILGECGGMMALSQSLTTADGETHEMAGVLPADVTMCDRYQALDHVELAATRTVPTARQGDRIRGHEFHYSRADHDGDARFGFETIRGDGIDGDHDGLLEYETLGTYAHVHAESGAFDAFLDAVQ